MKTPIETILEQVAWQEVSDPNISEGVYATHRGTVDLAGHLFRCYQLSNGRRVLDADDVNDFFGYGCEFPVAVQP